MQRGCFTTTKKTQKAVRKDAGSSRVPGKTVLVTGSTGRLGRALIKELLAHGYHVRAYAEKIEQLQALESGVVPFVGDINDKEKLGKAMQGVSYVFHLAAIVSEYKAYTDELVRVNVEGTANVVDLCIRNNVKKLVYTSTVDVYGKKREGILTEESEPKPSDRYGHTKMLAEKEIIANGNLLDYTIFRVGTIYGRGFEHSFFKIFRAIKEKKAYIIGNGTNYFALVNIDDVIKGLMLGMDAPKGVYNLTDGVEYTQQYLFNFASKELGLDKIEKRISPVIVSIVAKRRGLDSDELRFITSDRRISIEKAKKVLGFKPKASIEKEGREMIKDFEEKYKRA